MGVDPADYARRLGYMIEVQLRTEAGSVRLHERPLLRWLQRAAHKVRAIMRAIMGCVLEDLGRSGARLSSDQRRLLPRAAGVGRHRLLALEKVGMRVAARRSVLDPCRQTRMRSDAGAAVVAAVLLICGMLSSWRQRTCRGRAPRAWLS